jgi:PAS domain-containing protein
MTPSNADPFLDPYINRFSPALPAYALPTGLSWALALAIAGGGLFLRAEPIALLALWACGLGLASLGVLAYQALVVSALLSCLAQTAPYLLGPQWPPASLTVLLLEALVVFSGLLLGRIQELKTGLQSERYKAVRLRQLCEIWAQSKDNCLKELDLQGRLLAMSDSGKALMEVGDHDLQGASWLDFWEGEWGILARLAFEQALAGRLSRFSGICATVAGTPKTWDVVLLPVINADGKIGSVLSLSWDVTDIRSESEALRTARADDTALLEMLSEGFYLLDRDWRFVKANALAQRLLGPRPLLGSTLLEILPEERGGDLLEALRDAMEIGFPRHFQWFSSRYQTWFRINAYPRPDGIGVFIADISEDVARLRQLQAIKARLRLVQQVGRFADWKFDLSTRELRLSKQAGVLLGIELASAVHQEALLKRLHETDRLAFVSALLDLTEGQRTLDLTVRLSDPGSQAPRYFHFVGAVVQPEEADRGLLVGSLHDITDQQTRERMLFDAQAFNRSIIDALPQLVAVLDERGRVITCNRAWADYPLPAGAVAPFRLPLNTDYLAFCRQHAETGAFAPQALLEGIEALLENLGQPFRLEYELVLGGERRQFQAFAMLMASEPSQVLVVHEDISDAVQLKNALAEQTQRLALIQQSMNDGMWEWNPTQQRLYVSARFTELLGVEPSPQTDFGVWLRAQVHPEQAQRVSEAWPDPLPPGHGLDLDLQLNTPGGWRWFRLRGQSEWRDQRLLRVAGSIMDISLQHELRTQARHSETRLRQLLQHRPATDA